MNDPDNGKPWDLGKRDVRARVKRLVRETRRFMLIGSPLFSSLQNRSKRGRNAKEFAEKLEVAKNHIRFCAELYQMQLDGGRFFLHGHPSHSTSWSMPEMVSLAAKPGVGFTTETCAPTA